MALHSVYLGIGSNINPRKNIVAGIEALSNRFGPVATSSTYLSRAVGFSGPPFLNLVARIETPLDVVSLLAELREIEYRFGRPLIVNKFSSRHLDIDLLTYDDLAGDCCGAVLPRQEITFNAHVLCPFAELAPNLILPNQNRTLAALWLSFDDKSQKLCRFSDIELQPSSGRQAAGMNHENHNMSYAGSAR